MSLLRISEVAQRRGYTQASLAEKMGVSISTIRWYYQQNNLSLPILRKLAKALDCEVWQLIATENEVLQSGEGEVLTPDNKRYKLSELRYCFDSKL